MRGGNYLVLLLVSLLRKCNDRKTIARAFGLLQEIVATLAYDDSGDVVPSEWSSRVNNGDDSGGGAPTVGGEEERQEDGQMEFLQSFCLFTVAVEAVKNNDKGLCVCMYVCV